MKTKRKYRYREATESLVPRQDLDSKTTMTEKKVTTEMFGHSKSQTSEPWAGSDYGEFGELDCPSRDKVVKTDCYDAWVRLKGEQKN